MSPRAVATYITGGKAGAMAITPKYIGHRRLVEIAISTLVTDRSLLLAEADSEAKQEWSLPRPLRSPLVTAVGRSGMR